MATCCVARETPQMTDEGSKKVTSVSFARHFSPGERWWSERAWWTERAQA
eukprot:CAMPEP_0194500736 /NCGR_PEP_ID=MMETSP0253-20130528/19424_1 /TAXON_ID=2966 /ORGANISM="Noctiluca scintillans" /LENGTH=49 /DNA_ID= /DNA_START= /DNA_END= /DNA_ORIENTATION=